MKLSLAPWYAGHETYLAGSVYTAAPGFRAETARTLVDAGIAVHADVMAPHEGLPSGVTVEELAELAAIVPRELLGIHLIGTAEGVEPLLPLVPDCADLYVPYGIHVDRPTTRIWAALWDEFGANIPAADEFDGYDGLLIMLLEPGTSGAADPSRLALSRVLAPHIAVAVDGGVTPELIPQCLDAGVSTVVVGRALLTEASSTEISLSEGQS
ncbi:hypothetical protein [Rhodococcoides kyotonense]|uniref:Pentose-5-phosphate-3-epimerase n=1 Tax=Rhodococcoides kyotonense TaxID=398843 RepID=A0A239M0H7_9NOCA|nr:hypothetical protein [Rhodococcus kyotonensis]SNT35782.1 Pentose-5-phosphate-3-epimerase [Rhodococcus kyotonensis]